MAISQGSLSGVMSLGGLLFALSYAWIALLSPRARKFAKLPPGPKPKPFIGNLLDLPAQDDKPEPFWSLHRRDYGPISSLRLPGQVLIIIHSPAICTELMEKRAIKHSGRPRMVMNGEIVGADKGLVLAQPGPRFRSAKRLAHTQLRSFTAVDRWKDQLELETRRYLLYLLETPADFVAHCQRQVAAVILRIVYGYTAEPHGDQLIHMIDRVMDDFNETSVPGKWLVDSLPFLKYLPAWLPDISYRFAMKQIASKSAKPSLVSETHKKHEGSLSPELEHDLKWTALAMYAGGSDTTFCTMEVFFLEMALNPEAQSKAQAEIDDVIGTGRLPNFSDRHKLPYLDALIKESFRWENIGSLGIPHLATQDDEINGYFIPKGAMLVPHIAGILHDPAIYKDPHEFRPERFLGKSPEMDPHEMMWGFGRRVCPGRFLAIHNLFLIISNTLSCFTISSIKGEEPKREFVPGTINHPMLFKVDIQARGAAHDTLIREVQMMEGGMIEKGDSHLL